VRPNRIAVTTGRSLDGSRAAAHRLFPKDPVRF
jgi:hypothetical protein